MTELMCPKDNHQILHSSPPKKLLEKLLAESKSKMAHLLQHFNKVNVVKWVSSITTPTFISYK